MTGRAEVPLTPRHSFGLVAMWEKEGFARFGVECYYTGQQRLENNPYRSLSSPYVIFGAMGERKVATHVKLFLNLENLGNVRQSRWDPILLPSRAADGRWTVDAWAPLDGRRLANRMTTIATITPRASATHSGSIAIGLPCAA